LKEESNIKSETVIRSAFKSMKFRGIKYLYIMTNSRKITFCMEYLRKYLRSFSIVVA